MFFHNKEGNSLDGYMNFTLSYFDIKDFDGNGPDSNKTDEFKKENDITQDFNYCR